MYVVDQGFPLFACRDFPFPVGVARAADFDGDGMLDLVWQVKGQGGGCEAVYVSWLKPSKNNIPMVAGKLEWLAVSLPSGAHK